MDFPSSNRVVPPVVLVSVAGNLHFALSGSPTEILASPNSTKYYPSMLLLVLKMAVWKLNVIFTPLLNTKSRPVRSDCTLWAVFDRFFFDLIMMHDAS
jgi:hypothetical protein